MLIEDFFLAASEIAADMITMLEREQVKKKAIDVEFVVVNEQKALPEPEKKDELA
jgi:hypothetical protein